MKNFFAVVGVLVVVFIGIGIWQNWFKFAVNSEDKVTFEVDGKKVKEDSNRALEAGKEKLEELKKKDDTATTDKTSPTGGTGTKPADTPGPLFGGK
jgi:cytoskeletal protein RodZ